MGKIQRNRVYHKSDFDRGDFILFEYAPDSYIKGEIIELNEDTAIIEVALPTRKSEELDLDTFEVEYSDIIPIAAVFIENIKNKGN